MLSHRLVAQFIANNINFFDSKSISICFLPDRCVQLFPFSFRRHYVGAYGKLKYNTSYIIHLQVSVAIVTDCILFTNTWMIMARANKEPKKREKPWQANYSFAALQYRWRCHLTRTSQGKSNHKKWTFRANGAHTRIHKATINFRDLHCLCNMREKEYAMATPSAGGSERTARKWHCYRKHVSGRSENAELNAHPIFWFVFFSRSPCFESTMMDALAH